MPGEMSVMFTFAETDGVQVAFSLSFSSFFHDPGLFLLQLTKVPTPFVYAVFPSEHL